MLTIAFFHRKAPRRLPGLMFLSNRQIAINNTNILATNSLWRDLQFNSGISWSKNKSTDFLPHNLHNFRPREKYLKFLHAWD
jgi:hypothetical protein